MREVLVDLIQRIPYGVMILHETWNYEWDQELSLVEMVTGIDENWLYTKVLDDNYVPYKNDKHSKDSTTIKPFLRPLSDMTDEEKKELFELCTFVESEDWEGKVTEYYAIEIASRFDPTHNYDNSFTFWGVDMRAIDWLNEHHFDYRGLINKNLAVPAPEGMYKIKK